MEKEMEPTMPMCDICKARPMPLTMHTVNVPTGLVIGLVTCLKCGHVISVLPIGTWEPEIVEPRIIRSAN
jgi:hypothetical protein